MAEHILRARAVEAELNWRIYSAGTDAIDAQPMMPHAAKVLAARGFDARNWQSRRLTQQLIAEANLILTAEQRHRELIAAIAPRARRWTFPLLQFARLVDDPGREDWPPRSGPDLIELALETQGMSQPPLQSEDLDDPVGKPRRYYRQCADLIEDAIDAII